MEYTTATCRSLTTCLFFDLSCLLVCGCHHVTPQAVCSCLPASCCPSAVRIHKFVASTHAIFRSTLSAMPLILHVGTALAFCGSKSTMTTVTAPLARTNPALQVNPARFPVPLCSCCALVQQFSFVSTDVVINVSGNRFLERFALLSSNLPAYWPPLTRSLFVQPAATGCFSATTGASKDRFCILPQ